MIPKTILPLFISGLLSSCVHTEQELSIPQLQFNSYVHHGGVTGVTSFDPLSWGGLVYTPEKDVGVRWLDWSVGDARQISGEAFWGRQSMGSMCTYLAFSPLPTACEGLVLHKHIDIPYLYYRQDSLFRNPVDLLATYPKELAVRSQVSQDVNLLFFHILTPIRVSIAGEGRLTSLYFEGISDEAHFMLQSHFWTAHRQRSPRLEVKLPPSGVALSELPVEITLGQPYYMIPQRLSVDARIVYEVQGEQYDVSLSPAGESQFLGGSPVHYIINPVNLEMDSYQDTPFKSD